jgi:hypothetical protein
MTLWRGVFTKLEIFDFKSSYALARAIGKNRIMIFGPTADGAYIVQSMSARREVKARAKVWRGAALLAALILGGCTRDEATARLKNDIQPDSLEIVHARFPCRSPDIHFFGYRFRIFVKGETSLGDICWDFSTREWTWQILPDSRLSHLNSRK